MDAYLERDRFRRVLELASAFRAMAEAARRSVAMHRIAIVLSIVCAGAVAAEATCIATGGGCLATLDLCAWMVSKLLTADAAAKVRASFEPVGGFVTLGSADLA